MKAKDALIAVIAGISILTSGCSMVRETLGTNRQEEPPCTGPAFDLWSAREVLGPEEPFNAEVRRAISAGESTTLDAVAAVAGWQGKWDRMIDVRNYATTDMLNDWAGTTSVCWSGISNNPMWAEGASEAAYLFMDGATPVQVVRYTGPEKLFVINRQPPVVERHTVLTSNGLYLLTPE